MGSSTHRPLEPTPGAASPDADLLRACATGDRSAAFEEIVRRHGRTVYAVCHGVLRNGADADDAFQATFLVLLNRVGQDRPPAALSGWLYGVAVRVARRARYRRARNSAREAAVTTTNDLPIADPPAPGSADPAADALDRETRAVVWAEVGAMPDAYRNPLVLCYFEDRTTEQAAAALNCPVGTLRSRLVKARKLLQSRLVRRGVTLSAATAVIVLAEGRAAAAPPPELLHQTTTAAGGAAAPSVAQLVEAVLRDMATKWWPAAVLATLLGIGAVLVAVGGWSVPGSGQPAAGKPPAGPGTLLVVSQRDATVTLIDPTTGKTRATVPTDPCPHEIALSPDGRTAAVSNYGLPFGEKHGRTVTLIDVAAGRVLKTIEVGAGVGPHGLHWLDARRLLCTAEQAEAVVEIDAAHGKVVRTIRTAQSGTHTVTAADTKRAYTANVLSGTVSALDLEEGVTLRKRAVGKGPEGIAVSPNGKRLWVGNRGDRTLAVLAADDLSVLKTLPAPGVPIKVVFTTDGKTVAVTEFQTGELSLFDAENMTETRRVKLSGGTVVFDTSGPTPAPAAVAISADGKTAYCTMFFSKAVAVVDLTSGAVTRKIDVAAGELDGIAISPVGPMG